MTTCVWEYKGAAGKGNTYFSKSTFPDSVSEADIRANAEETYGSGELYIRASEPVAPYSPGPNLRVTWERKRKR